MGGDTTWTDVGAVKTWGELSGAWSAQTDTWAEFSTEWTLAQGKCWDDLNETWSTIDKTWGAL